MTGNDPDYTDLTRQITGTGPYAPRAEIPRAAGLMDDAAPAEDGGGGFWDWLTGGDDNVEAAQMEMTPASPAPLPTPNPRRGPATLDARPGEDITIQGKAYKVIFVMPDGRVRVRDPETGQTGIVEVEAR
jgi:hypothetical protein